MNAMLHHLFLSLFLMASSLLGAIQIDVAAESAVLMNGDSGVILLEKNPHEKRYPASTTKIATTIFALLVAQDRLNEVATADHDCIAWVSDKSKAKANYTYPSYYLEPGATHISLKKGESLPLKDLLYGVMLVSGDDASNLVAKHLGGDIPTFMNGVNAYLQKIGCLNTHMNNPHGLFHPEHYTTAYDLAIMTKEALKNQTFREIVKTARYTRPRTNMQEPMTWVQTNLLLRPGEYFYPYAIGVKTGYIQASQNNLVAAAEKDGRLLIAVLLKNKQRKDMFKDAIALFEAAFNEPPVERVLLGKGGLPYSLQHPAAEKPIKTCLYEDVVIRYYPAEEPQLSCRLSWDSVALPIKKGQRVGELALSSADGLHNRKIDLLAEDDVDIVWWRKLIGPFKDWNFIQIIAAFALIVVIVLGLAARHYY